MKFLNNYSLEISYSDGTLLKLPHTVRENLQFDSKQLPE